jgi:hypothetical protein
MVIQIGLGTGMHVSTYSVLFRFGIFVSLNCIPFQFLCTYHIYYLLSVPLLRAHQFWFISCLLLYKNNLDLLYIWVPVKYEMKRETKYTETERN